MNSPGMAVSKYAMDQVDVPGYVAASKNIIGRMTNIAYKRTRQLMQVGLQDTDSVAAKELIGNLATGYAGLSQTFISLTKHHSENIQDKIRALSVFENPANADKDSLTSLKGMMVEMYGNEEKGLTRFNEAVGIMQRYEEAIPTGSDNWYKSKSIMNIGMMSSEANIGDMVLAHANRDMNIEYDFPNVVSRSAVQDLGTTMSKQLKLNPKAGAVFRKGGKIAVMAAAGVMALNFFRPNQLSSSANPLDAFTDLGTDIDGNHNGILSPLELERGMPLDMVDASFSKQAFIKMNNDNPNKKKSNIISDMLSSSFNNQSSIMREFRGTPKMSHRNYTTKVGYLGSAQLRRRSEL